MVKRILLVEDNPHDVELAMAALQERELDSDVFVARDGEQALDYLHRRGVHAARDPVQPALILLDLKLPKILGSEVLAMVKRDPALRMVPVVVLTSSREDRDITESYRRGANAYVVKPVDFSEFSRVVNEVATFWTVVNQPPPGCIDRRAPMG